MTLLFFLIAFDVLLYHSEVHISLMLEGKIWGIGDQRLREVGYYFLKGSIKCCCLAFHTVSYSELCGCHRSSTARCREGSSNNRFWKTEINNSYDLSSRC